MRVLDLFCGAGGLAAGFKEEGFSVTGIDKSALAGETFKLNGFGEFIEKDLLKEDITGSYDVITGGPPCRPWSMVNTTKRGKKHQDYALVGRFFRNVMRIKPRVFLFENVPPVRKSGTLEWWVRKAEKHGYVVSRMIVNYSDFGASTRRHRFIAVGIMNGDAKRYEGKLEARHRSAGTVKSRIWELRDKKLGEVPDHVWPQLTTIEKYRHLYEKAKYGWYILKWEEAAPSFGNVMKTYILHPESFNGGATRVISVREASLIMGFANTFRFPERAGLGARYQMIADSVSPVFSRAAAATVKEILTT